MVKIQDMTSCIMASDYVVLIKMHKSNRRKSLCVIEQRFKAPINYFY